MSMSVLESYILPGFNRSPGTNNSSPVDTMHILIFFSGVSSKSTSVPILANSALYGTRSGQYLVALNKGSPLRRSHPIGLNEIQKA